MAEKNSRLNYQLHVALVVLLLLGSFLTWEKDRQGQDFLDNYIKDETKWMIIDFIVFALLLMLIMVNRGCANQKLYIMALIVFIVMKALHLYNSHKLRTHPNPSGGNKSHLNDLFYNSLFNGFILGVAACYLLVHYPNGKVCK